LSIQDINGSKDSRSLKGSSEIWRSNFNTCILHELEAFICKVFKGEAIVCYCEPLITQQMEISGSPFELKIDEKNE